MWERFMIQRTTAFYITVLALSGLAIAAFAGIIGKVEGDLEVEGVAKVRTTGTPNFITGDNGDVYVQDQLEVDGAADMAGDVTVDGNTFRINTTTNKVGIN